MAVKGISSLIPRDDDFPGIYEETLTKQRQGRRAGRLLQGGLKSGLPLARHNASPGPFWKAQSSLANSRSRAPQEPPRWPNPASYSIMEGSLVSRIWSVRIQGMDISIGNWIRRPMVNSRKNSRNQSWERSQHCCRASGSTGERAVGYTEEEAAKDLRSHRV